MLSQRVDQLCIVIEALLLHPRQPGHAGSKDSYRIIQVKALNGSFRFETEWFILFLRYTLGSQHVVVVVVDLLLLLLIIAVAIAFQWPNPRSCCSPGLSRLK